MASDAEVVSNIEILTFTSSWTENGANFASSSNSNITGFLHLFLHCLNWQHVTIKNDESKFTF